MLGKIILYSFFSGITVFIGGLLASSFNHRIKEGPSKEIITHFSMSFGAGIILAAVALVLIPRGMEELSLVPLSLSFVFGASVFLFLDLYLTKKGGNMATLMAMVMDFIPESMVLGAVCAIEPSMALLIAVLIGFQNLPEAFNSFNDLSKDGFKTKKILTIFFFLSFVGVGSALIGFFYLTNYPYLTAHLMIMASGGILYLLIQDIIPESKSKYSYFTSIGGVLGFLVGIIGDMLI